MSVIHLSLERDLGNSMGSIRIHINKFELLIAAIIVIVLSFALVELLMWIFPNMSEFLLVGIAIIGVFFLAPRIHEKIMKEI